MGILEKLGLKKKTAAVEREKTQAQALPPKISAEAKKPALTAKLSKARLSSRSDEILLMPILSEKARHLAGQGKYVFAVAVSANKSEIKKSIESVYSVGVRGVRIVNLPAKTRRYGRTVGKLRHGRKR